MEEVKLKGSIFLSVKELMILTGRDLMSSSQYESARREHQSVRDSLGNNKKRLTVREFCSYEKININEVIQELNKTR